ncbi:MAG: hypothetical protein HKN42_01995, partial [Granulosicoccus sp.]|nr:hypothetical protein [Granulosicoccus sp.]
MNDSDLFQITVPVFQHYLPRMRAIVSGLSEKQVTLIDESLAPHAFSAALHLQSAVGFVSRTIFPLIGEEVPEPGSEEPSIRDLLKLIDEVDSRVLHIEPDRFNGAAERIIR